MVVKSYGKMRGTRSKLSKKKVTPTLTRYLQQFKVGDRVHVDFVSHRIPHPRLQGLTGCIVEKRGSGYVVEVRVKRALKKLSLRPEHLKLSK